MYTFDPGQVALVTLADTGEVVGRLRVASVRDGITTLSDGSCWFPTGLPVDGSSRHRLTAETAEAKAQLERLARFERIAELFMTLKDLDRLFTPVTEGDLDRLEQALVSVILSHSEALSVPQRERYLRDVAARVDAASERAVLKTLYVPPGPG